MSKVRQIDAYTRAAHKLAALPEGWTAHKAKARKGEPGSDVTGAVFKPYRFYHQGPPAWSRRVGGTAQTVFVSDDALEQALEEMRAEVRAKNRAKFKFMFVIVDDEADAADFLNCTIFPDFYRRDQMISEKGAWGLIQKWGGEKVKTDRIKRVISAALDRWNTRAGEVEAQQRKADREAMA